MASPAAAPPSDLSYPNLVVVLPQITGRRLWKKTKEKKEAVWPPLLETALVDALEKYRPQAGSAQRDYRLLRRFPKRNRFISDYIFSATGESRTAKQVGSRLQQMRETCQDERLLNLLSRHEYSPEGGSALESLKAPQATWPVASESRYSPAASSPISSTSDSTDNTDSSFPGAGISSPPRTVVTIELIPPSPYPSTVPRHNYDSHYSHDLPFNEALGSNLTYRHHLSMDYPSEIKNNNPVVAFAALRQICTSRHYSYFRVIIDGICVHSEITELALNLPTTPMHPSIGSEPYTYSTKLIPRFWAQLSYTEDFFRCVIEQEIVKAPTPFNALPAFPSDHDQSVRSFSYKFQLSTPDLPVFYPPPLPSELSIPAEFPRAVYPAHFPTSQTSKKNSQELTVSSPSQPEGRPQPSSCYLSNSSAPPDFMLDADFAVYGWNLGTTAIAHATATPNRRLPCHFFPQHGWADTADIPLYCGIPPSQSSQADLPQIHPLTESTLGSSDQWPAHEDDVLLSSMWSNAHL
ncbi:hypothetical protein B0H10DRAFT_1945287 [Mycena sp. CBHHK59/15]|nr:hypothetical protein B0H10DRAFT_1945287 [Mycena sp. CBHHK59/15]